MKSEIKKIDSTKRQIKVELRGEVVKNKFEEVFKRIGKEAKVPGFRQGHAPRDILEKNYSSQAHQMVLEELIPDTYAQVIKQENLDVVELPSISDVKLERDALSFSATVETNPEIPLKEYKGLKVGYKKIEVTPEELKRTVDSLRESRGIDAADESLARRMGYPDLQELQKALERQIFLQKDSQQRQRIESEVVEAVTKDLDFKLPQSMVERQLQELSRRTQLELAMKGAKRQDLEGQEKELKKKLEPEARKQVKVYLVMAAIARKEGIPLDDQMPQKVVEFLLKEANWQEAA